MPDHILPPPTVSTARPPTYAFDHAIINRSHDKRDDESDNPHRSPLGEQPDALLGVPDRSASASAPPDLEISSRSLFAFKAGYSGIFSDIRMDEDYESFYYENPERTKLPPPLPPNAATISNNPLSNASSITSRLFQQSANPVNGSQISRNYDASPHSVAGSNSGMARLPPRAPSSSNNSHPPFSSVGLHGADPHVLRRDDSNASFEDLIFRESRTMRPTTSNPSSVNSSYREDESSFQNNTQNRNAEPFRLESRADQRSLRQVDQIGGHPEDSVTSGATRNPSSSGQYLNESRKAPQRHEPRGSSQTRSQSQLRVSGSVESKDMQNDIRRRQMHGQTSEQFATPSKCNQQQALRNETELQSALWNLGQMSLQDGDNVPSAPRNPPQMYGGFPAGYDSGSGPRSSYSSPYGYNQSGASGPGAAAAAAAAAAAVAAAQHSSSPTYMSQHHSNLSSQEWSQRAPGEGAQKPLSGYENSQYMSPNMSPNGTGIPDMLSLENQDDSLLNYGMSAQPVSGVPYNTIPGYRDAGGTIIPNSRPVYLPHQMASGRRVGGSRGRSSSPHRLDSVRNAYGYDVYAPAGGRAASYTDARARAVPLPPDYLNAQAAAAAAAAAAAVYQSNGVSISSSGGLGHLRSSTIGIGATRVGNRGAGRNGDSRRSAIHHQDGYSRGSNQGNSLQRGSNGDQRILDRNNENSSSGSAANMKFSSFSDVVGRAEELARDQHGCRFLQTKLEEGNVVYINSIFEECYEKFVDLMTDPFGNYLCQKLFEFCNDAQRLALVERCAPAIPHVSTNMHGTRAVQRMVECLSTQEQIRAVCNALKPAAVSLMKDINGNHVIQRCLHRMDPANNQFVYDAVAANCFELATHRHGCCVMQRCMDFASPMQRNQLAQQINANALPLVQNAFGNYVVQYVLQLNDPVYTAEILRRLRGHIAELSMQKFSSNVVEKGLQLGSRETRRELIDELISDQETMRRLLHDAYGNYVIQRALQTAEGPQLECICEAIRPHLHSLKQSPYGKRIQAKIMKRMPKGLAPLPPTA